MTKKEIKDFFESQLKTWETASQNYNDLKFFNRKHFKIENLSGFICQNPRRAVSTLSKVDSQSISQRKCFLCKNNRPPQQLIKELGKDWELLVNPYPILPYHFTIVSKHHRPQHFDLNSAFELADQLEGMVVFYNDDGAGASAPDHAHFQAVPIEEIPVLNHLDSHWDNRYEFSFPFRVFFDLANEDLGKYPLNAYVWKSEKGEIRGLAIPRKNHRPKEYYLDPPLRRAVSPGALDMVGIVVTPFEEDFNLLDSTELRNIYKQVGVADD